MLVKATPVWLHDFIVAPVIFGALLVLVRCSLSYVRLSLILCRFDLMFGVNVRGTFAT